MAAPNRAQPMTSRPVPTGRVLRHGRRLGGRGVLARADGHGAAEQWQEQERFPAAGLVTPAGNGIVFDGSDHDVLQ